VNRATNPAQHEERAIRNPFDRRGDGAEQLQPSELLMVPKVSVVIPCYNYAHFLGAAVDSALDQPGVDVEIILADNCSTDTSLELAQRLADDDTRIRVRTQTHNKPYLENYNDAIADVTGEFVVVLDADDLLTPGSLTRSAALMVARPDVAFVYGYCVPFSGEVPKARSSVRSWSVWSGDQWIERTYRLGRNVLMSPEVLARTTAVREVGAFDTEFPTGADALLWLRLADLGGVARLDGPDQAFYRIHGNNLHYAPGGERALLDLTCRQRVFDTFLDTRRADDLDTELLRAQSREALARYAIKAGSAEMHRDGSDSTGAAAGLSELAVSIWPAATSWRQWSTLQRLRDGTMPTWQRSGDRTIRRVRSRTGALLRRYLER
jgi:Glycosyl transferase family 2